MPASSCLSISTAITGGFTMEIGVVITPNSAAAVSADRIFSTMESYPMHGSPNCIGDTRDHGSLVTPPLLAQRSECHTGVLDFSTNDEQFQLVLGDLVRQTGKKQNARGNTKFGHTKGIQCHRRRIYIKGGMTWHLRPWHPV